jgi:hypothetical protein
MKSLHVNKPVLSLSKAEAHCAVCLADALLKFNVTFAGVPAVT